MGTKMSKAKRKAISERVIKEELIDYVPFYIGKTMLSYWGETAEYQKIQGVIGNIVVFRYNDEDGIEESVDLSRTPGNEKLLLRSLSRITKKEAKYILDNYSFKGVEMPMDKHAFAKEIVKRIADHAPLMLYLIKQGFDVFRLIDCGLAIEIDNNIKF